MAKSKTFTPAIQEAVLAYIRTGGAQSSACSAAGVNPQTLSAWLIRGTPEALEFKVKIDMAVAECEQRMVLAIQKAARGHQTKTTKTITRDVTRIRKERRPDGTVIEMPMMFREKTVEVIEGFEMDWRAAESWLERRRPGEWKRREEVTGEIVHTIKPFEEAISAIYGADPALASTDDEDGDVAALATRIFDMVPIDEGGNSDRGGDDEEDDE